MADQHDGKGPDLPAGASERGDAASPSAAARPGAWETIRRKVKRGVDYFKHDLWRYRRESLSPVRKGKVMLLRIIVMVIGGFERSKCQLRASAMTFYTVLGIVPLVALAFGIAKGFGFDKLLERQLYETFIGQEAVLDRITEMARSLLEQTRGGAIAGIGLAVLLGTVIKVMLNIEDSMNDIWEVEKPRNFSRKFSDYLSIMAICPILVIISSSINVFITTQVTTIAEQVEILGVLSPFIFLMLKLIPYALFWALFTMIYMIMPNTEVPFYAGLVGGIIGGTIYQLAQWTYIRFQVGVANYNAIYGSFAALPLFLVWIQLSWLIVLLGAHISYAIQSVDDYDFEPDVRRVSPHLKKRVALLIVHAIAQRFARGDTPMTAEALSTALSVPVRLVRKIIDELIETGVLIHTHIDAAETVTAYLPARDIHDFTIAYILDAMENRGVDNIPVADTDTFQTLTEALKTFYQDRRNSPSNRRLVEI
jgi:membrane protein